MKEISKFFYSTLVFIQLGLIAAKYFSIVSWGWDSWKLWVPLILFVVLRVGYWLAYSFEGFFMILLKIAVVIGIGYLFVYLFVL